MLADLPVVAAALSAVLRICPRIAIPVQLYSAAGRWYSVQASITHLDRLRLGLLRRSNLHDPQCNVGEM